MDNRSLNNSESCYKWKTILKVERSKWTYWLGNKKQWSPLDPNSKLMAQVDRRRSDIGMGIRQGSNSLSSTPTARCRNFPMGNRYLLHSPGSSASMACPGQVY